MQLDLPTPVLSVIKSSYLAFNLKNKRCMKNQQEFFFASIVPELSYASSQISLKKDPNV
jgi:hypothetical protein